MSMLSKDLGFRILKHSFGGGVYCKLMEIEDGREVPTHKHKFDHLSTLFSGCCIVEANGQQETYYAPDVITIMAGVVHTILAVNGPVVWGCIHATDETDADNIDETLIEPTQHMVKTDLNVKVDSALSELNLHPELWNKHTMRTESASSPHHGVDDIWLRYKDPKLPIDQQQPHDSVWYGAIRQLPAIRTIIEKVMLAMPKGAELGGVLITKIPPGGQVKPHSDAGTWHAEYYNQKVLVLLQSAPGQSFNYANESHEGVAGDVFTFNNLPEHWVVNNSSVDRISLILAIRDVSHAN
jgi:quercetin dioxygenase-like cupin family protein